MSRFPRVAAAMAVLALGASTFAYAAGGPARMPANALRVQRVQIMDNNGFERPLPATFAFVPVGWQTQGGVVWGNQYACTNGYNFTWSARSPDGLQTVAILPQDRWETNNYGGGASTPGCRSANIMSIQQYLQLLVARLKPGARMLDFRARPDLAAQFRNLNKRTPSAMGEFRTWVESGEALFAYNEQGRDMRGVVAGTAVFNLSHMGAVSGMQAMDSVSAGVFPLFAATAPNGQLNLKFTEAIRQSFLPNPEWNARIAAHNGAISQVALQESIKRSKIIAETNDYISRLRQETAASKAKSDERNAREFGEVIRGTEHYNDSGAAGGQVELSGMYDHAWKLNDGTYVLSNDASFDPWKDLQVAGTRLERTQ
jgi:hypothetical protein